jgi:hypothetical protein
MLVGLQLRVVWCDHSNPSPCQTRLPTYVPRNAYILVGTLTKKQPVKKGRAIVETDLDGSYVLTEESIEESKKVKLFEHFIDDLKMLLNGVR